MEQRMKLAQSFTYKGRKVSLILNHLNNLGSIYINNKLLKRSTNTTIPLLRKEAHSIIDKEEDGNISNYVS